MFAEWPEPSMLDKIIVAIHKAICIGAPPTTVCTPLSQFLLASSMGGGGRITILYADSHYKGAGVNISTWSISSFVDFNSLQLKTKRTSPQEQFKKKLSVEIYRQICWDSVAGESASY